jgi:hypothetical protein
MVAGCRDPSDGCIQCSPIAIRTHRPDSPTGVTLLRYHYDRPMSVFPTAGTVSGATYMRQYKPKAETRKRKWYINLDAIPKGTVRIGGVGAIGSAQGC